MATLARENRIFLRPDGRMALTWAVKGPAGAFHLQVVMAVQENAPETWLRGGARPPWSVVEVFAGRHAFVRLGLDDAERDDCDILPPNGAPTCGCWFNALDSWGEGLWASATRADGAGDDEMIYRELAEAYAEAFNVSLTP